MKNKSSLFSFRFLHITHNQKTQHVLGILILRNKQHIAPAIVTASKQAKKNVIWMKFPEFCVGCCCFCILCFVLIYMMFILPLVCLFHLPALHLSHSLHISLCVSAALLLFIFIRMYITLLFVFYSVRCIWSDRIFLWAELLFSIALLLLYMFSLDSMLQRSFEVRKKKHSMMMTYDHKHSTYPEKLSTLRESGGFAPTDIEINKKKHP